MKKFTYCIDCYTSSTYTVKAETHDEAEEKMQAIIDGEAFFDEYRKGCDFFEPTISDCIEETEECEQVKKEDSATPNFNYDQYCAVERINTYDEISRALTNYENCEYNEQDLYELLVRLQNNWDIITHQEGE